MNTTIETAKCPKCSEPFERREGMFYWRGESYPGHVCVKCNALWAIPGEEMPPLRPVIDRVP